MQLGLIKYTAKSFILFAISTRQTVSVGYLIDEETEVMGYLIEELLQ